MVGKDAMQGTTVPGVVFPEAAIGIGGQQLLNHEMMIGRDQDMAAPTSIDEAAQISKRAMRLWNETLLAMYSLLLEQCVMI